MPFKNKVSLSQAFETLSQAEQPFATVFTHGTLAVEIYQPDKVDLQQPHDKDEAYIISSGSGQFELAGEITDVKTGDFLFAPAGVQHRFINFTDDFSTWVIFYGPIGGEANLNQTSK